MNRKKLEKHLTEVNKEIVQVMAPLLRYRNRPAPLNVRLYRGAIYVLQKTEILVPEYAFNEGIEPFDVVNAEFGCAHEMGHHFHFMRRDVAFERTTLIRKEAYNYHELTAEIFAMTFFDITRDLNSFLKEESILNPNANKYFRKIQSIYLDIREQQERIALCKVLISRTYEKAREIFSLHPVLLRCEEFVEDRN